MSDDAAQAGAVQTGAAQAGAAPVPAPNILVVEDDPEVRGIILAALDAHGYASKVATTGKQAIALAAAESPDIVLLDLGLPDIDGVEVVRAIRAWSEMPIIVVSARSEDADKIGALDAGADDYVCKPFSVGELLARIRATERHLAVAAAAKPTAPGAAAAPAAQASAPATFTDGGLAIDYVAGVVTLDGEELHLTPIEYRLLCLLSRNVGKVLTHGYILDEVWGRQGQKGDLATLRVYMGSLRKKIERDTAHPRYIQTHVGVGYRMMSV